MSNVNYVSHENLEYFKGKIEALIPTETTVSNWGFTKNAGTITGIKMNGSSKGTSGVVDLGTVITSLSGYATETWVGQQGYITGITKTMVTNALGYTPPTADTWRGIKTKGGVDYIHSSEFSDTESISSNFLRFWNGRISGGTSNLQYCDRGRFGTIVTAASTDYLSSSGGEIGGLLYVNRSSNKVPSLRWNKEGNYWGGLGYNNSSNVNFFGPVKSDGTWANDSSKDIWYFQGTIQQNGTNVALVSDLSSYLPTSGGNYSVTIGAASANSNKSLTVNGKAVFNPSYNTAVDNFNEGIRINRASNNWAEVLLGAAPGTTSGCPDYGWIIGRRGSNGTTSGAAGDLTLEFVRNDVPAYADAYGRGLTLYANGNRPTWNGNGLAYTSDIPTIARLHNITLTGNISGVGAFVLCCQMAEHNEGAFGSSSAFASYMYNKGLSHAIAASGYIEYGGEYHSIYSVSSYNTSYVYIRAIRRGTREILGYAVSGTIQDTVI